MGNNDTVYICSISSLRNAPFPPLIKTPINANDCSYNAHEQTVQG